MPCCPPTHLPCHILQRHQLVESRPECLAGGAGRVCWGGRQSCAAVPPRTDLTSHCHQLSCCLSSPLPNLEADGVPAGETMQHPRRADSTGRGRCTLRVLPEGGPHPTSGGQTKWQSTVLSPRAACLPCWTTLKPPQAPTQLANSAPAWPQPGPLLPCWPDGSQPFGVVVWTFLVTRPSQGKDCAS